MKKGPGNFWGILIISAFFLIFLFSGVQAEDVLKKYFRNEKVKKEVETEVKSIFEKRWKAKVKSIKRINIDEGYEVILKNPNTIVLYLRSKDGKGKYFVLANIIADDKGRLISKLRVNQILNAKADKFYKFVSQYKKNAIIFGKGKTEVYVFLEPHCPHCRRLYRYLKQRQNKFTVYAFPVGYTEESRDIVKLIYCKKVSLDDVMTGKLDVYSAEDLEKKLEKCKKESLEQAEKKVKENDVLFVKVEARGTPFSIVNNSGKKMVIRGANLIAFDRLAKK